MARGSWLGARGSWLVARGSWLVARGSWLAARGSWLVARGSWLVARGSWLVARGSWLVARGSWLMAHGSRDESRASNYELRAPSHEPRATSLQSPAHGRNALRVEPEPVHAAHVARVFDLDAAVHDDGHAARSAIRAPSSLITPNWHQSASRRSSPRLGDGRQASGARKTFTTSTGTGTSSRLVIALLAEDLRLARVHRNHAIAMALR